MKNLLRFLPWAVSLVVSPASAQSPDWRSDFKNPPAAYRPAPFWHLNGKLTTAELERQLTDVRQASGFGGVVVLPVTAQPGFGDGTMKPGMEPAYLSEEYFAHYETILKKAKSLGLQVIWYDDVDFPSGTASGRMKKLFPNDTRKVLSKKDTTVGGGNTLAMILPSGTPMATVAMNTQTRERVDLATSVSNGELRWSVPAGTWKIMAFTTQPSPGSGINDVVVDYLDPQAVDKFFTLNHAEFYKRFPSYFGSTIRQLFFDDVGFITTGKHGERTWTTRFNEAFKKRFGTDPALYYPALWEDIGPETSAARVAFFDTRAELLAEGFPRKSAEWAAQHGLKASGHPPGNYEIQPVDMNGDILKYYRHQPIPLMDLIFSYGHGREGYKLISSAATAYDRPVVAAEIYGAIAEKTMDPILLYRAAMEVFVRGVNFLIPHGMWYNPDPKVVRIPPLISAYDPEIGPELPRYTAWAGRCSYLLQGGQTVADVAILYPIASLQAWFRFDAPETRGWNWGKFVAPGTDYLALGDTLTNRVHRDFTFLHPETLAGEQVEVVGNELLLKNKVSPQRYRALLVPGGRVISWKTLQKIKAFHDAGGRVIATSVLPSQSAEVGFDTQVQQTVKAVFGIDPTQATPTAVSVQKPNAKGGQAVFIPQANAASLIEIFEMLKIVSDVRFDNNRATDRPMPASGQGALSYLHKKKDGRDIYFFANSSNDPVRTTVELRGTMKPEFFDPNTGEITPVGDAQPVTRDGQAYTRFALALEPVKSVFVVAKSN